jgi:hypothetical protein
MGQDYLLADSWSRHWFFVNTGSDCMLSYRFTHQPLLKCGLIAQTTICGSETTVLSQLLVIPPLTQLLVAMVARIWNLNLLPGNISWSKIRVMICCKKVVFWIEKIMFNNIILRNLVCFNFHCHLLAAMDSFDTFEFVYLLTAQCYSSMWPHKSNTGLHCATITC